MSSFMLSNIFVVWWGGRASTAMVMTNSRSCKVKHIQTGENIVTHGRLFLEQFFLKRRNNNSLIKTCWSLFIGSNWSNWNIGLGGRLGTTSSHMNLHYNDVIMGTMTSQITSLTTVYTTAYSGADKKNQSSASLAFVRGIHRWPVNSPHHWPVTRVSIWWCHHEGVHITCAILCLQSTVLRPKYSGNSRSVTWFLMSWILVSPGHQQQWYWF